MDAYTSSVFEVFISLATFDVLENIPDFLSFLDSMKFYDDFFDMPEGEPKNIQFEAVGLDSPFFINNMGTVMVQINVVATVMLSAFIASTLVYKTKYAKRFHKKQNGKAFWNGPIIIIQENYGMIMLAGLLTVTDVSLCFANYYFVA